MSGRITAIIPVKSLASAKTRMATHLSPTDRIELARYLLLHVLDVVGRSKAVERYLVVSPDSAVLALARSVGALPVLERDYVATRGQNAALEQAREVIRAWSTEAILVLAGDLPLLSVQDLQGIAELGSSERIIVIAPDRHDEGTNALLVRPGDALPFCFGTGSYRRHLQEASQRGLPVREYRGIGTAFDLDFPEDLSDLERLTGVSLDISGEVRKS